jgi:hypothetical protein
MQLSAVVKMSVSFAGDDIMYTDMNCGLRRTRVAEE